MISDFVSTLQQCCQLVDKELTRSHGYSESNYQSALLYFLNQKLDNEFTISREVNVPYMLSCGYSFGSGRADIICENSEEKICYILELKCADQRVWKRWFGQLSRYVTHHKTEYQKVGMIVLFNCNTDPIVKLHRPNPF